MKLTWINQYWERESSLQENAKVSLRKNLLRRLIEDGREPGLYIDPVVAPIIQKTFEMYASGDYSDLTIAEWMNQQTVIQQLRAGKKPIGKETVRDMLKNKVYTGYVPYAETLYSGSLGQGKRSSRNRKTWFEGKHEAIISDELYKQAQEARKHLTKVRNLTTQVRTYVMGDRVFCARCIARKPSDIEDANYGKMRPHWHNRDEESYYRCLARDRGYHACEQKYASTTAIDEQVVEALNRLVVPEGFRERVEQAVQSLSDNAEALKKMDEIRQIVERIDFSWEKGFMTPEDYIEKRNQLQRELEVLRPVDYDDLIEAADLIENFGQYWDRCGDFEKPEEARQQLVAKIVDRVFVYDDHVVAIALHLIVRLSYQMALKRLLQGK